MLGVEAEGGQMWSMVIESTNPFHVLESTLPFPIYQLEGMYQLPRKEKLGF